MRMTFGVAIFKIVGQSSSIFTTYFTFENGPTLDVGQKARGFMLPFVLYITRCNVPYIAICHVVIRYVTLPTLPTLHTLRYIMLRPPRYLTILHVVLCHHTLRDGVVMCLAFSCNPNEKGHTKPVVWVVR